MSFAISESYSRYFVSFSHCSVVLKTQHGDIVKEKDSSESALCGRKLPLWLGLLLLLAAVGLLVPMIYFAVIANSKACVDGLQAQKECQEVNQHVQRQLTQAQELLHKKEAEAATCKQAVVSHCSPSRGPRTWRSLPGSLWRSR